MSTSQVAQLLGTEERIFLNDRKRFEKTLIKKGCIFTTEGRGKTALYHFEYISKEAKQMVIAKRWEELFGFKPTRAYLALSYYTFLMTEPMAAFMSDAEAALELCGSREARANINVARNELIKAGLIEPLGATEYNYFFLKLDGTKERIEKGDYSTAFHFLFEVIGFHADGIAKKELEHAKEDSMKDENDAEVQETAWHMAWADMKEEFGTPIRVKERKLTNKQLPI